MTSCVLSSEVLLCLIDAPPTQHKAVGQALERLAHQGCVCYVAEPSLPLLWQAPTRPLIAGGFGLSPAAAREGIEALLERFPLLEAGFSYAPNWLDAAVTYGFSGEDVTHAQTIATLFAHGVSHLLSLGEASLEEAQLRRVDDIRFVRVTDFCSERT